MPFDAFSDAMSVLQKLGVPVQGYSQAGLGHGIDPAGMQIGIQFLADAFDGKSLNKEVS